MNDLNRFSIEMQCSHHPIRSAELTTKPSPQGERGRVRGKVLWLLKCDEKIVMIS
jgi:hypothetical protein